MFKRQFQPLACAVALVAVTLLMFPAVAFAGAPAGSGPADALAPTDAWQHLNPGQEVWYAVSSAGADSSNKPSKMFVRLHAQPAGSAAFNVWTQARMQARAVADNPLKDAPPVGVGARQIVKDGDNTVDLYGGDLVWTAGLMDPETYYVQVRQTGAQPSDYRLSVTGDTVSFPTAVPSVQVAAAGPAANSAPLTLPATGTQQMFGNGPDTTVWPTGQMVTINPGQQHWYQIRVPGTSDSTLHPSVFAELAAYPSKGAKFSVWTPERLRARAVADNPAKDAPPVGQGTPANYQDGANTLSLYGGDLVWRGDAKNAVTYYIVVEPTGQLPVQYRLNVMQQ